MLHAVSWGGHAATNRLAATLALSIALHALAIAHTVFAPRGMPASRDDGLTLQVRLAEAAPEAVAPAAKPSAPVVAKKAPVRKDPEKPAAAATGASALPAPEIFYRASELDERAVPVNDVTLEYPKDAFDKGVIGAVVLRLRIGADGVVRGAEVVEATPAGIFDDAALNAARGLRFRPAMRNGVAVASLKTIEVPFHPDCGRTGTCIPGPTPLSQPAQPKP